MSVLEAIQQGFAGAVGDQDTLNRIDADKQHRQHLANAFRQRKITETMAASNNLHKQIALMLNPDTMTPLPGKEQQVATLRNQLSQVDSYIKQLYNPQFDPQKGQITEDPLHKLSDKLHLTKAPVQPDVSGQQVVSANQDSTLTNQAAERQALETKVEQTRSLLKKYGASDQIIQEVTEGMLGGAKPGNNSAKSDFGRYLKARADELGIEPSQLSPQQIEEARAKYMASGRAAKETIVPDPESSTGFAKEGYDSSGNVMYHVKDVVPPRTAMGRETTTTDPFGVTTHSVSQPVFPGKGTSPKTEGKVPASGSTPKQPKPLGVQKKELQSKIGQGQLDSNGHISETDKVNPYLREAANNLLDGMAVKDLPIPAKDRGAAEALAKRYGWMGQGMFTPKDKLLIRESTAILSQLSGDKDALSVLDDSTSRQKIVQVLHNPEKRGAIGGAFQTLVAGNLTPQEQKFVRLYNQAVGRISGLSQLVRSGRATEAQIERLKTELPNPATTASAEDARQKLALIQNEIDIALSKGQFSDNNASGSMSDDEFLMKVGK